jgi:hypothetical protein
MSRKKGDGAVVSGTLLEQLERPRVGVGESDGRAQIHEHALGEELMDLVA